MKTLRYMFSAVLIATTCTQAQDANGTWIANVNNANWSTDTNWQDSIIANGAGYTATFDRTAFSGNRTIILDSNRTIGGLSAIGSNGPSGAIRSVTVGASNNVLTLNNNGSPVMITNNGWGNFTVNSVIVLEDDLVLMNYPTNPNNPSEEISAYLTLGNDATRTISSAGGLKTISTMPSPVTPADPNNYRIVISAPIVDGDGQIALVHNSGNNLNLQTTGHSFSGGLYINSGTVNSAHGLGNIALGAPEGEIFFGESGEGVLQFSGIMLEANADRAIVNRRATLNGDGTINVALSTNGDITTIFWAGEFVGSGSLIKTGARTLNITGSVNNGGDIINNQGTLILSGTVNNGGDIINNTGTMEISADLNIDGALIVNSGTVTLTGNNNHQGGNIIRGGELGISDDSNLGPLEKPVIFDELSSGRLATNNSMTSNHDVIINCLMGTFGTRGFDNHTVWNGQISGPGMLEKRFVGTLELTRDNTYQGDTLISTGVLLVTNTTGSATGTGNVYVNLNTEYQAVLGGTGIIAPDAGNYVSIIAGNLQPGVQGVGALTFNFSGDSKLDFWAESVLDITLGEDSTKVVFSSLGDWLIGSNNAILNISLAAGFTTGKEYVIFENVTTPDFTFAEVRGIDGYDYTFGWVNNNYVLTVIPEPSTFVLVSLALGSGIFWIRRSKKTAA